MSELPLPLAVLFDLDGTLADTVPQRIAAWREAMRRIGIDLGDAEVAPEIGRDGVAVAQSLAERSGVVLDRDGGVAVDASASELFDGLNSSPTPLPGVREVMAALDAADVPWAIATSSGPGQVLASVNALGLPSTPRVVDGSRVAHAKPAPDLLLLGAQEMVVAPERCWYVGDSTWDMSAAIAAGMVPIAVMAGSASDEPAVRSAGAVLVVDTLAALADRLRAAALVLETDQGQRI